MAYRFKRKESVENGLRRIAGEQLQKAIDEIGSEELDRHEAVHQVRKRFKKIRGLVRLARPGLGETYDTVNRWYRDAGRRLSRVRDAESVLEALEKLRTRFDEPFAEQAFADVEGRLKERRRKIAEDWTGLENDLAELREQLHAAKNGLEEWSLSGDEQKAVWAGFQKTYRRGCRAISTATTDRSDEALHEWRKRMKYHWYHLRLLQNVWKPVVKSRADELSELSDLLGDDHDLAVFTQLIKDDPAEFGSEQSLEVLLGVIRRRRRQLQKAAFQLGSRVCAEKPKGLRKRMKRYWQIWRD